MRRRIMASVGGNPLPYLRRVAYLESHGTEFINTGIRANSSMPDYSFEVGYAIMSLTGAQYIFGTYPFNTGVSLAHDMNSQIKKSQCAYGVYKDFNVSNVPVDVFFDGKLSQNSVSIGGLTSSVSLNKSLISTDFDITLFKRNGTSYSPYSKLKISYFNVLLNDVKIMGLVPVLDISGRPAMYDEVSGQLFYNQGTGEFTWGELDAASALVSSRGGGY